MASSKTTDSSSTKSKPAKPAPPPKDAGKEPEANEKKHHQGSTEGDLRKGMNAVPAEYPSSAD